MILYKKSDQLFSLLCLCLFSLFVLFDTELFVVGHRKEEYHDGRHCKQRGGCLLWDE